MEKPRFRLKQWPRLLGALIFTSEFMIPFSAADDSLLPKFSEIPNTCKAANQWIPDHLEGSDTYSKEKIAAASEAELIQLFGNTGRYYPFMLYNAVDMKTIEWTSRRMIQSLASTIFRDHKSRSIEKVNDHLDELDGYFSALIDHPEQARFLGRSDILSKLFLNTEYSKYESVILSTCKVLPLRHCKETWLSALQYSRVYHYGTESLLYSATPTLAEYATRRDLMKGLAIFSKRAIQKIKKIEQSGYHDWSASDVLSDLVSAFKSSGKTAQESLDSAILTLGAYSIRGASLLYSVSWADPLKIAFDSDPLYALAILSITISHFDRIQLSLNQRPYFLPKPIRSHCSYGKPYHFWMAANIAYQLTRSGLPKTTSAVAVSSFGIAYELLMTANGRNLEAIVNSEKYSAPVTQTRLDMLMKTEAAFYGAELGASGKSVTRNIQRLLYRNMKKSDRTNPDKIFSILSKLAGETATPEAMKIQSKWVSRISPEKMLLNRILRVSL